MPFPQVSVEKPWGSLFYGEHSVPALSPREGLGLSHFHEWERRLSFLPMYLPCVDAATHLEAFVFEWEQSFIIC